MSLFSDVTNAIGLTTDPNDIPTAEFTPMDITSGAGTATFDEGVGTFQLSPELQATYEQLLGGGREGIAAAGGYDPYAAAETLFGRMDQILAGGRERQRQGLESRLLSQGRLGSTGGAFEFQGLESTIEAERARQLNQAFGTAQQVQQGMFGRGLAELQAGIGLQGIGQSQLALGLQAGQGAQQAQMFNIQNQIAASQQMPSLLAGLGTGALTGWAAGGFK